jgi:NADPH:quinone reductase
MQVVRIHEQGGPDVLRLEEAPTPDPGPGQARVRVVAAGVNFIDIYQRSGQYRVQLPFAIGGEGAGTVEAVGPDVADLRPGTPVAWAQVPGSYATHVVAPVDKLVPVPEGVRLEDAAALMLQGMTAHYLSHSTYPLKPGDACLVHAAAGGVGRLLVQMAKLLGAKPVIGTVSTEAKAEIARAAGADEVIRYTEQDFEKETLRITQGQGVSVVYDSVGRDTFEKSLACLRPRGVLVLFGASSGPVPPCDPLILMRGSHFLTRPTLGHYIATRDELLSRSRDLFGWLREGRLRLRIARTYPLSEAGRAQTDLAGRGTAGKLLLIP